MSSQRTPLYDLLPKWVRFRDHNEGKPLKILMDGLEGPLRDIERDIEDLYDSWFIETCAEWAVPYLGDLLGVDGLEHPSQMIPTQRRRVANTMSYRRSKGTLAAVARAAEAACGWPCHGVEYRHLVGTTPSLRNLQSDFGTDFGTDAGEGTDACHGEVGRSCDQTQPGGALNLRDLRALDRLGSPFSTTRRWGEPRQGQRGQPVMFTAVGDVNLRTIGLAFYRLRSYPIEGVTARALRLDRAAGDLDGLQLYSFHPLGLETPLFNRVLTPDERLYRSRERHLPMPLPARDLAAELERSCPQTDGALAGGSESYFGRRPPFRLEVLESTAAGPAFRAVPPSALRIVDLSPLKHPPKVPILEILREDEGVEAMVDPRLGWFVTRDTFRQVRVDFCYGASTDLGGGPYTRSDTLTSARDEDVEILVSARIPQQFSRALFTMWSFQGLAPEALVLLYLVTIHPPGDHFRTLAAAFRVLGLTPGPDASPEVGSGRLIIRLADSGTYVLPGAPLDIGRRQVVLQADDGVCPMLYGDLKVRGETGSELTLSGLWLEGRVVLNGRPSLTVLHSSIHPLAAWRKQAAVLVEAHDDEAAPERALNGEAQRESPFLVVRVDHSIVGPLHLPKHRVELLEIRDSIVDGGGRSRGDGRTAVSGGPQSSEGPATRIERSTVFGHVHLDQLWLASNVLFTHTVQVTRNREGQMRYCYCPSPSPDERLPSRHKCLQEDGEADDLVPPGSRRRQRIVPTFTSTTYGHPGYAQLSICTEALRQGGENGNEIGAYHSLRQSDRLANLDPILDALMPVGFRARIEFVT